MVAIVNIPFLGAPPPGHTTGMFYPNYLYGSDATSFTQTAARLYYTPYYINEIRAYAGFVVHNNDTAASGQKCRTGVYTNVNGQPGTLLAAGAEITYGATAIDNVAAVAFTPTYIGWHWLAYMGDSATVTKRMSGPGGATTAGVLLATVNMPGMFGIFLGTQDLTSNGINQPCAWIVDTSYGALASTALAPTAVVGGPIPWIAIKA